MPQDIVRVLRVIEYVGERDWVESAVSNSIQGRVSTGRGTITAVTLTAYPEIVEMARVDKERQERVIEAIANKKPWEIAGSREREKEREKEKGKTSA